jgi:hypothetical protein
MRVLPVTLDQLLRLKQKIADDSELHDFAKELEGMAYCGGENHQILLIDDDGYPIDDVTLQIMQILWEAGRIKRLH